MFPRAFRESGSFQDGRRAVERWPGGWLGTVGRPSSWGSLPGALEFLCWKIIPIHTISAPFPSPTSVSELLFYIQHNLFEGLKVGGGNLSSHRTFSITLSMAGNRPHLSFSLYPSLKNPTECPEYSRCRCRMELWTAIVIFPVSFSLPFLFFFFLSSTTHSI